MNKSILIQTGFAWCLATFVACSSTPTKSGGDGGSEQKAATKSSVESKVAGDSKSENSGEKNISESDIDKAKVQVASSQYATLNEAILHQNDDKIYSSAVSILTLSPSDLKALNSLSMYHYKKGHFDLSKFLINKAISSSPKSAELYSNMGIIHLALNQRRDAIKAFRKALELQPEEPIAASNLGAIYVKEKDWSKAAIVLEIAHRKGIRDPRVLNNYAMTLVAQGKFDKAEGFYKEALADNHSNSPGGAAINKELLFNYSILLVDRMQKYPEGLEVINRLKFVGGPPESRNKINALENRAKAGLK